MEIGDGDGGLLVVVMIMAVGVMVLKNRAATSQLVPRANSQKPSSPAGTVTRVATLSLYPLMGVISQLVRLGVSYKGL